MRPSFSSFQAYVAFTAGLTSVAGAIYSGIEYLRPPAIGEVVAVVQDARTAKPVRGGSLEVQPRRCRRRHAEPLGRRADAPRAQVGAVPPPRPPSRFATVTRQIEVPDGGTVGVHFALAQRADESGGRATPVGKARQLLRRLGF